MIKLLFFLCSLLSFLFGNAQNFTSSNLPIIVIDTHGDIIHDEPKIMADMGIIYNGEGVTNNLTDTYNDYSGKIGIELRGSTSQYFPKKPYSIELRDEAGAEINASLLGMPAEGDWVLNAVYNDRSLMRDALAYKLGRDLGRYAPRTRYCELVLNNEYQGVYLLVEKIKRDKNRVDISKLEPSEINGDDLTGGYILKIDKYSGNSSYGFDSEIPPPNRSDNQFINFQYDYPKPDEIVSEQKQYIKTYIKNFETVLNGAAYRDTQNGYKKYIDVNSFVDFLIINEVAKNVDGYRLSTYMYKNKDSKAGKLTMGPIWDFNLAFGNADYCLGGFPQGWMYNFNQYCNGDFWLIPFWWDRLMSDVSFRNLLSSRWQELRQNKFSTASIQAYVDSVANVMNQGPQQRNFERWPILNEYVWPNYDWEHQTTYSLAVNWMKNWINQRMYWLDNEMPTFVTGIETHENEIVFSIYPNPFKEDGIVEYEITRPGSVQLTINDLTGSVIGTMSQLHSAPGKYQIALNQFTLSPGIYFCSIENMGIKYTKKIIKQ